MVAEIQFLDGIKEQSYPIVKLTKSLNGKAGTACFLFVNPKILQAFFFENKEINKISLIWNTKIISSNDITIFFKNGKPFLIKSIFVLKNPTEWFEFLNFMNFYSKEKGLFFDADYFFKEYKK
jgi:photosystem II protein